MEGSVAHSYLGDILHVVSQALLAPDIILLLVLIGYALFSIGSVIAEYITEHRYFKVTMPKFLAALMSADEENLPAVIEESGLIKRQKVALLTVYDYRTLPGDALVALIRRLVSEEESHYDRITGRNNMAARVAPMLGLMGTLIPLGPGIQALGRADTAALSSSLLVAFDTTVAGLVVAAVCLVIGKVRGMWYGNYMSALDSAMATMLQKIEEMRAEGKITIEEPSNYAFLYEQTTGPVSPRTPSLKNLAPKRDDAEAEEPKPDFKPTRATQPISQAPSAQQPEGSFTYSSQPLPASQAAPASQPASANQPAPASQPTQTPLWDPSSELGEWYTATFGTEQPGTLPSYDALVSSSPAPAATPAPAPTPEPAPAPAATPAPTPEPAPAPASTSTQGVFPRPVFMTPKASNPAPSGGEGQRRNDTTAR